MRRPSLPRPGRWTWPARPPTATARRPRWTRSARYRGLGRLEEAAAHLGESVRAYAETDDRYLGADTLDHYGDVLAALGRHVEALETWARAAEWFAGVDDERVGAIRGKVAGA